MNTYPYFKMKNNYAFQTKKKNNEKSGTDLHFFGKSLYNVWL